MEMPPDATDLAAGDPPLHALLAAAHSPGHTVTAQLPRARIGLGGWPVVWSVRDGSASPGLPLAQHGATVFVLPTGTTPVGVSADENATAGNNSAHIVRDTGGHVHMIWVDSGRADGLVGAMYRRADTAPDGAVRFETGVLELGPPGQGEWNAYPSLAAVGDTVHFVWQGGNTAHYRRLTNEAGAWRWSEAVDIGARSTGRDVGPAIAVGASGVHIITPDGIYAHAADGGRTWVTEPLPLPPGGRVKTASVALDPQGRPLVVASVALRTPPLSEDHGSGGAWTLLLWRRAADGRWQSLPTPLSGRPEWAPPDDLRSDVLADWARIAVDQAGGMHLTWHGTAVSRIYGNDRAYYAWHGPGAEAGWGAPMPLRDPDPARGYGFSYAPSLALAGDMALPLVFYGRRAGAGDSGFDVDLLGFRDGVPAVIRQPVTRYMQRAIAHGEPTNGLATRFPAAAPAVYHAPDGRIWLDILETLVPTDLPDAMKLVVYQRIDLTGVLSGH